jgi:hypothetical protein
MTDVMTQPKRLTQAQSDVLLTGQLPLQHRTLEILVEGAFIMPGWPMRMRRAGTEYVERKLSSARNDIKRRKPGVPLIKDDRTLFDLLSFHPDDEVWVYRGSLPMLLHNRDLNNPIALLDPVYRWKVEALKSHGKFLEKIFEEPWPGSYGYRLKDAYRPVLDVPLDGEMVQLIR